MIVLTLAVVGLILLLALITVWAKSAQRIKQLEHLVNLDALTGLLGRDALFSRLTTIFDSNTLVSCLYIDLRGFKQINDTQGHAAGDACLIAFTRHLQRSIPKNAIAARMGGDEFCVIVPDQSDPERVVAIAKAIQQCPAISEAGSEIVTCNIGISHRKGELQTVQQLLHAADAAMYEGKRQNQGIIEFDETLSAKIDARANAVHDLEDAVAQGAFELVYQPKFMARSMQLSGAEALMRWPGKLGPAGSPSVFIPLAEEMGLIGKLGEWALDVACAQIVEFGQLPISVNVSGLQLIDPDFPKRIADRLIDLNIAPHLLELEITESVLVKYAARAGQAIHHLRRLGVQVSLDDFGTGYSSLNYLQQFEFDTIKIDRSFVRDISSSKKRREIVKAIVKLANGIGAETVAEGAETHEQIALLQLLGCDHIQGYALGIPGSAEEIHRLMAHSDLGRTVNEIISHPPLAKTQNLG